MRLDEPSSYWDIEQTFDRDCPKCGLKQEVVLYANRHYPSAFSGRNECQECSFEWELDVEYNPYD
jgi:hypothetical protein